MESSFRFGRISGIEIGAHWTWLLIVALIVWSLAAAIFPDTNPGLSDGTYIAMGVVAAILFFASLLAHELGHALQAQREDMQIDGITLWVFGGVARFKDMFPSANAELRIALAGPLVSLVLGVAFLGFALLVPLPSAVDGVVYWLGYINLVLLAFNMIPALPLDGGRVLRALLWRRREDFRAATRSAAALGRGFGQFLIAGGLVVVLFGGVISGLWFAFIGWFLLGAAEMELRSAETQRALEGLRARDVMVRDPITVSPDESLDRFMEDVFFHHRHVSYPVCEGGRPQGLISFRSVVDVSREEWPRKRVRDVMTEMAGVASFPPDRELGEVLNELVQNDLHRGLVVEDGRLSGLVSITDTARVLEVRTGSTDVSAELAARGAAAGRR